MVLNTYTSSYLLFLACFLRFIQIRILYRKERKMKRIFRNVTSFILACLTLASTVAFASDSVSSSDTNSDISFPTTPVVDSHYAEAEVSVDDLENGGITVAVYLDENNDPVFVRVAENTPLPQATAVSSFHVGLKTDSKGKKYMHWVANGSKITRIGGYIICKATSGNTQYQGTSISFSSKTGASYAQGMSDSFSIPSSVKKVKVGWSWLTVTSQAQGAISIPSAYTTVTL